MFFIFSHLCVPFSSWFLILFRKVSFIEGNINILLTLLLILLLIYFYMHILHSSGIYFVYGVQQEYLSGRIALVLFQVVKYRKATKSYFIPFSVFLGIIWLFLNVNFKFIL